MENNSFPLITEPELFSALPIPPKKIAKLRVAGNIPVVRVDKRTRLYDFGKVIAALEKLEIATK
jgi:hypothetical protein